MRNDTAAGRDFGANVGANAGTAPVAFVVAVWLGMPREEILRGLGEGWIAPPPGSPPGWTPAAWAAGPAAAGAPVGTVAGGNPLSTTAAGSPVESIHAEYDPGPTRDDPARADVGLRGDDPPLARLVELQEHHPLPGAQQQLAVDHRDGRRGAAHQHLAAVSVAVEQLVFLDVLGPQLVIVVLVVALDGDRFLDEAAEVVEEAGFGLVDHHRGGGVEAVHGDLAVTHAGAGHYLACPVGEIPELDAARGVEVEHLGADAGLGGGGEEGRRSLRPAQGAPGAQVFIHGSALQGSQTPLL